MKYFLSSPENRWVAEEFFIWPTFSLLFPSTFGTREDLLIRDHWHGGRQVSVVTVP